MGKHDELRAAITAATIARVALDVEREAARKAAYAAIDAEFCERMAAATDALYQAQKAEREHIDATASHPLEGRRVYRMVSSWRRFGSTAAKRIEGMVEVRRTGTNFPTNLNNYSLPALGDPFIRKLKKDGTPGVAIYVRERVEGWKPA